MPNELFKITKIGNDGDKYHFVAEVDPTSHILRGHFEGQPVVPGVCTLTMVKQCICVALHRDRVQYESIKECKFLAAIVPQQHSRLDVKIEFKAGGGVVAEVVCNDVKMMKLKCVITI